MQHGELYDLSIAHIDCDCFYAAVEKRDNPDIADKPVIIGGGKRGVVSTACYIARIKGVKSAMPMFKALKLCPDAVVIHGDMSKYTKAGHEIRQLMQELTPMVEPLSIDEAFLDLTGTERHAHAPPAISLARLINKIQEQVGISVSAGLSHNKFLAKVASDLDKPRGFSVIGKSETKQFLADQPVSLIWGVGKAMQNSLAKRGINRINQLLRYEKAELIEQYGVMGSRLYHLSRGEDNRKVSTSGETKSISNETTFSSDISDYDELETVLWQLCENVSRRAKNSKLAGYTVNLKLKTSGFKSISRSTTLTDASFMANRIFDAAAAMLRKLAKGQSFRLIGVGISHLEAMQSDQEHGDLDQIATRKIRTEQAMDKVRNKFGQQAVVKGRSLRNRN